MYRGISCLSGGGRPGSRGPAAPGRLPQPRTEEPGPLGTLSSLGPNAMLLLLLLLLLLLVVAGRRSAGASVGASCTCARQPDARCPCRVSRVLSCDPGPSRPLEAGAALGVCEARALPGQVRRRLGYGPPVASIACSRVVYACV